MKLTTNDLVWDIPWGTKTCQAKNYVQNIVLPVQIQSQKAVRAETQCDCQPFGIESLAQFEVPLEE